VTSLEWRISDLPVDYPEAVRAMEGRAAAIRDRGAPELVWLLEHPALYTAGASARDADLLDARFPVHRSGRGGQYTYHGPGQRIAYAMLDVKARGGDVRAYVGRLEDWLIRSLAAFGVRGERREGRVGVWIARAGGREDKIAAVGVRLRRWVSYHGVSLNVDCDLSHYDGIVPCGVREHGVTSLRDLGVRASRAEVDIELRRAFDAVFG